jgi:pyruvate,water dikinase
MMIVKSPKGTKEANVPRIKQKKQKLIDKQMLKLAEICRNIEKHYKKPQDIEWALIKGKIYITQSRPITTL